MVQVEKNDDKMSIRKLPVIGTDFPADAVILAAGDFPARPAARAWFERLPDRIFCCDRGVENLLQAGYRPQAVIGDGDSVSAATRKALGEIFIQIDEQEDNDLSKTMRHVCSLGYRHIVILGATGAREDHTLGNLSLLADYALEADVIMETDYGRFVPICQDTVFRSFPGQQISIFPLDGQRLTLEGLRWPLQGKKLRRWWEATLNEALGSTFTVRTEGWTLVYLLRDDPSYEAEPRQRDSEVSRE